MSKDKDYEELLRAFEDSPKKASNSENSGAKKPSATPKAPPRRTSPAPNQQAKKPTPAASNRNTFKPVAPPVKTPSGARPNQSKGLSGGVYFSNPPRDIDKEADRQRGVTKTPSKRRKANYTDNSNKKAPSKPTGNKLQRFVKSQNFKKFLIMLAVIVSVSAILCFYGIRCINDVLSLNITDEKNKAVEVTVQSGMTDGEVIDILHDNDLINNKLFCKLFIKFFNVDGEYVEGVYTLTPRMGVEKMLATMKRDFTKAETITLTFPEGWNTYQIAEKLDANGVCSKESFISTVRTIDFTDDYSFLAGLDKKDQRFCALEGYLYPDTYEFYKGENASSVVRRFLDNFKNKWTKEYSELAKKQGLSIDEVVTLASIIQKEAATKDQMPKISSVLHNRLQKPNAFPLLQCDSTEDYLLKTIKPTLTSSVRDTERYIHYRDSYDTYSEECKGLPIGAIANPGDDAIYAAIKPADTNYLYFRHDVQGGVYYASSFAEHEQNGIKADKVKK